MNPSVCQIAPPVYERLRLTIPAREALERAGNQVRPMLCTQAELGIELYVVQQELGVPFYSVTLVYPPTNLELVLIGQGEGQHRGLRLSDEQAYPGEWPDGSIAWPARGSWTPCPRCGAALRWHEAGYVQGYRICLHGHTAILSGDGRVAYPDPPEVTT
jgi:hypothetical protein